MVRLSAVLLEIRVERLAAGVGAWSVEVWLGHCMLMYSLTDCMLLARTAPLKRFHGGGGGGGMSD